MQKGAGFKVLSILHKGLMMGQILFSGICIYLVYTNSILPAAKELDKILQVVALIATAGGIYGGMTFFKKKLMTIRAMQADAKEKFALYRTACLIQWALLEGPSIFCTICFFLTGNYAFLALVVVILFVFVMTAPSKLKMQLQLQISEAELDDL
jgi:ABC-type xylose transport system permease subunit